MSSRNSSSAPPRIRKLNWRASIVDLLKLLDIDSSFAARARNSPLAGLPVVS
jgi:hypothetical protein